MPMHNIGFCMVYSGTLFFETLRFDFPKLQIWSFNGFQHFQTDNNYFEKSKENTKSAILCS